MVIYFSSTIHVTFTHTHANTYTHTCKHTHTHTHTHANTHTHTHTCKHTHTHTHTHNRRKRCRTQQEGSLCIDFCNQCSVHMLITCLIDVLPADVVQPRTLCCQSSTDKRHGDHITNIFRHVLKLMLFVTHSPTSFLLLLLL